MCFMITDRESKLKEINANANYKRKRCTISTDLLNGIVCGYFSFKRHVKGKQFHASHETLFQKRIIIVNNAPATAAGYNNASPFPPTAIARGKSHKTSRSQIRGFPSDEDKYCFS